MRKCNTELRAKAMRNPGRKVYDRNRCAIYDEKTKVLTACLYNMTVTEDFKKKKVEIDGIVTSNTTRQFINDVCTGVSACIRNYEMKLTTTNGWKLGKVTNGVAYVGW